MSCNKMSITEWCDEVHSLAKSKGWWDGGDRNVGEMLMLVTTEIAEAMEAYRDGDMELRIAESGKPEGFTVELADAIIRIFDLADALDLPLEQAMKVKHEYNKTRPYRHGGKKT